MDISSRAPNWTPIDGIAVRRVKRFREKPDKHTAERLSGGG